MKEYIAFDSHKRYTLAEREEVDSGRIVQRRIEHRRGAIREYLKEGEPGTAVAVEATGNWYWIVSEIEQAGKTPRLVHPRKAKLMMGMINKTDKLDVHGLNRLQRNQTLPTVWIPPAKLRDLRELTRVRMVFSQQRARLKNRLQATLAKYGLMVEEEVSDVFGQKGREVVEKLIDQLPEQTAWASGMLLEQLDLVTRHLEEQERRLLKLLEATEERKLLRSLPGVGLILAGVMALEIGEVDRFADAERLASYAGTTPRVISSGGKTRYGPLRPDVNRYLKWAYMEAANVVAMNRRRWSKSSGTCRHASQLYERIKKGHAKAIGAVARHLAESSWHVLSRKESYRPPGVAAERVEPAGCKRRTVMSAR
ncbi:MAG: IS110 family transposase [Tepidisphaeraceae bacterium]